MPRVSAIFQAPANGQAPLFFIHVGFTGLHAKKEAAISSPYKECIKKHTTAAM